MTDDALPLSQHDLLTSTECAEIRDRVLALREHWTDRGGGGFFSLGVASYLDAARGEPAYITAAAQINLLLLDSFGWLYERTRRLFEALLGEPVGFHDHRPLPGFHVFILDGKDRGRDDPAPRAHFDLQWMKAFPGWNPGGTLSFTLPVEQPTGGASMAVWPVHYWDAIRLNIPSAEYASTHPPRAVEYAQGQVVVHDGLVLHAIGAASLPAPSGYRITLQGHGIRTPEGWTLYW